MITLCPEISALYALYWSNQVLECLLGTIHIKRLYVWVQKMAVFADVKYCIDIADIVALTIDLKGTL